VPVSGGNAYRIRSGRQKVALASAENLAITGRVKYTGIPGLELAASVNYQDDASQAGGDDLDDATLMSVHGIWSTGPFSLRALWVLHELEPGLARQVRDVFGIAGDEVVEPDDMMAVVQEPVGQVGAEESRCPCDEYSHATVRPNER
jgi:hypothetical protein